MLTDVREALRYLGCRGEPPADLLRQAERTAAELERRAAPHWVWRLFELTGPDRLDLGEGGPRLTGALAARALRDCGRAAVLVCSLGAAYDAWHRTVSARDMAGAALLDACASALTEAGCAQAEAEIRARCPGAHLTDRFSPGYGDLPLSLQPALLRICDAERRLGVTATESCMLLPVKSVTALIGLSPRPQPALIRGCACCPLAPACAYRREGTTCAAPD